MSKTNTTELLTAALPYYGDLRSTISAPSYPDLYAWATPSTTGGDSAGSTSLLEQTLKQASDAVAASNAKLANLQTLQQQLLEATGQNTLAVNQNTQTKGSGSSGLETAGNFATSLLIQGSILAPIISGIMGLFGSDKSAQPVYAPFIMPSPVSIQASTSGGTSSTTQAQMPGAAATGASISQAGPTQVQVQVNAIDSKSFIDHSDLIAEAVRQALLNSHSLGDVIAGL